MQAAHGNAPIAICVRRGHRHVIAMPVCAVDVLPALAVAGELPLEHQVCGLCALNHRHKADCRALRNESVFGNIDDNRYADFVLAFRFI